MAKVLFTHSYFLMFDPKQWKLHQPYAPLGTITAAAIIRENGFDVFLHDSMFCKSPDAIIANIITNKPEYLVIYDDGFNYLTKMCLTNMRMAAYRIIEIGKQYGCKVIVSSSDSTDHFSEYLKKGADFILIGEAEYTLLELLQNLESKSDYSNVAGIVYPDGETAMRTPPRAVMHQLDKLPMAAWDLVDLHYYRKMWMKKNGYFSVNIATTRGCPYKCNWCAKPIYGNRYNSRSPQHVLQELIFLHNNIGFHHIWFCDDIFGLKPGWIQEFAGLLKENGLNIKFKIQSRADILLKGNTLKSLSEAGCETIWMGVESGSQKILDAMDKGITVPEVYEVTRQIKELKMKPAFFLQLGYLGETSEDVDATLKMVSELMPEDIGVSVAYPLPGTKFYEKVKHDLAQKANWSDSDDLAMLFRNNYKPGYYKTLHRFIHKRFRKLQALATIKDILFGAKKLSGKNIYKAASSLWYIPAEALLNFSLQKYRR